MYHLQSDELGSLVDLKENIIMGHIIPGGTGYEKHTHKAYTDGDRAPLEFNFEDVA